MNLDTVFTCAQMAARQQIAALGYVSADIQALIDELTPAPVAEEVVEEAVEEAAPVVEEAVEEAAPVVEEAAQAE